MHYSLIQDQCHRLYISNYSVYLKDKSGTCGFSRTKGLSQVKASVCSSVLLIEFQPDQFKVLFEMTFNCAVACTIKELYSKFHPVTPLPATKVRGCPSGNVRRQQGAISPFLVDLGLFIHSQTFIECPQSVWH